MGVPGVFVSGRLIRKEWAGNACKKQTDWLVKKKRQDYNDSRGLGVVRYMMMPARE
jgi:hypothetical protein